ncbi:MAG: enoyl-CoA hydratase [Caldithrix sp.]|nr:enoyl-CoA hydratase [Caldithrix sp.]
MAYNNITLERDDNIAIVSINRPKKMNALNRQTLQDINNVFEEIAKDDSIGGILLTGTGEKAFVAGADISEIQPLTKKSGEEFARFGQQIFDRIEQLPKPVIALINGFALGGGCELALACHLRIAAENALMGQPEINLGLIPGYGGTQRLSRLIGKGRALEYLLTAGTITTDHALQMGLVNKVVPADQLLHEGKEMMSKILHKAPLAISAIIASVNEGLDDVLSDGLKTEARYFGQVCSTKDMKEGTQAFLEKREAHFTGQ